MSLINSPVVQRPRIILYTVYLEGPLVISEKASDGGRNSEFERLRKSSPGYQNFY